MGWPVVVVASGGIPVTDNSTLGYGTPLDIATNGMGTAVTYVSSGGLPVIGGTPAFVPSGAFAAIDFAGNQAWINGVGKSTAASLISAARSGSAYGTYSNRIAQFSSGAALLTDLGLGICGPSANIAPQSNSFSTSPWSGETPTASAGIGPDGVVGSAWSLDGGGDIEQSIAFTANATYTASLYVKQGTNQWFTLGPAGASGGINAYFDTVTGVAGEFTTFGTGYVPLASSMEPIGNGWFRCILTFKISDSSATFYNFPASGNTGGHAGSGNNNLIYGFQVEAGAAATAYMPTTTASASRAQDVVTLAAPVVAALGTGPWTITATVRRLFGGAAQGEILSDGTTAILRRATTGALETRWGGTLDTAAQQPSDWNFDTLCAISSSGAAISIGAAGIADAVAANASSVPAALHLGGLSTVGLNGIVKNLAIYRSYFNG